MTRNVKKLFKLFSENPSCVKQHPKISINPDVDECFCPICMKIFSRESLSKGYDDYLTLEDVPPSSFGGKPRTLTCKICNNITGSSLESRLSKKLDFIEVVEVHIYNPHGKKEEQERTWS